MAHQFTTSYTQDAPDLLRYYKHLGDRAIEQCPDADLFTTLNPESNSIAIIVKHMAGNLRSRFTDFLTTDGEKPDRNRDGEFEMPVQAAREELMRGRAAGWSIAPTTIEALTADDLERTVMIRSEPLLVVEVLDRLATHAAYH